MILIWYTLETLLELNQEKYAVLAMCLLLMKFVMKQISDDSDLVSSAFKLRVKM